MNIQINYSGIIDIKDVPSGAMIDVPEEFDLSQVLDQLGVRREHQKFIIPFVNNDEQSLSARLNEGDKVMLYLPVGGG